MPGFGRRKVTYKTVGEIRKSKIVNTAGCGALVEFPSFSGIMAGQNLWGDVFSNNREMVIHEKSLERYFDVECFVQPVSAKESTVNTHKFQIPVIRFPEYYYCPECHALDNMHKIASNYHTDYKSTVALKCNNCGTVLLPSRFVIACQDGHIEDFPYISWAHKKEGKSCDRPKLNLEYIGKTGGLESIVIRCVYCGASNSMAGCLGEFAFAGWECRGKRPWLGEKTDCKCGNNIRALMRSSNNVYYPMTFSKLTIPPWSNNIQKIFDQDDSYFSNIVDSDEEENRRNIRRYYKKNDIYRKYRCTEEAFFDQFKIRYAEDSRYEKYSKEFALHEEYLALIGPDIDDLYFKTETTNPDKALSSFISQIKLVKRLREVQVLYGFRRISSYGDEASGKMAPLSARKENWLPAIELFGEGIFVDFSKEQIQKWISENKERYQKIENRYRKKKLIDLYGEFSIAYILIHSISHLLIRELSETCGYDESSLKEKIFVNTSADNDKWMCGLLIYTATSSSDGSLGGLVRLGYAESFGKVFQSMLRKALWCSNDPLCIESEAQGLDSLNYAACHACMLIPEISCERNNTLLDRGAVIGTEYKSGFFDEYMNESGIF